MQQAARQMMNPAAEILAHRTEFGLTAVQVSALQPLADQLNVSVDRMFARQGQLSPARERMMRAISDSTVVLDEAAIRAEACEQATQQADYTIAMVRAQQRIAGILTAAQREKFEELQVNRGMQMMQAFSGTAEKH
ncbi:MAG: hypothetical protein JO040_07160 [Gemmatimonadetes bacterium]|nr:hypothetical protein [Gemmatimonadota bacterium]